MVEDKEMQSSVDESARTQTRSHEAPGPLAEEGDDLDDLMGNWCEDPDMGAR